MFQKIIKVLGGDPHQREIERLSGLVDRINALESEYDKLSLEALGEKSAEFKHRLADGATLDDILPEAFAAVREASKRTIGLRHYDVQMVGGMTLHSGKIAEMRTGEGNTLVATLPLYLNALMGRGAHLVTVNDYLARRDARWMAPVYRALGLTVGVLQMASRTENGKMAFVVDLDKTSPHEDQHQLRLVPRADAYRADITYGTNSEFGFDYLRDNLTNRLEDRSQRGHYFAIVDEVDNILIDEARTPLIISGPAQDESEYYLRMSHVVRQLEPQDYEVNEKDRAVHMTEVGEAHVEELLGQPLRDPERPEDITPEQARLMGYLEQALRAQFLYRRNKDYLVQSGKVIIIDEFTGRLMPGRRWSEGLHQAVEAKEGVKVEPENVTYATITIQNYFRMYEKLAGMSGTALTESEEFYKIYKLDVQPIPTNLEFQAGRKSSFYQRVESKDEQGYKYAFYARRDDAHKKPLFYQRKDYPDVVYRTNEAKLRAITMEILVHTCIGRPQLVGTTSVEHSEKLSARLDAELLRRLAQALLLRELYLEKNKIDPNEQRAIPQLAPIYKPLEDLDTGELRQMARSFGIPMSFNPEEPDNVERLAKILAWFTNLPALQGSARARLITMIQGGVPHQVLNARKHDEESKIIAKAGAFGAVTIATNMAGRGVDIKLGGELDEEILGAVNRALEAAGHDSWNMTNIERRAALSTLDPEGYRLLQGEAVAAFLQYMDEMEKVRQLGGLHVIGSERHEARRIDNQLRGRAARQGDPGSSRFYLALDDDLMRLFGGQQVEGLMARLSIEESTPIEVGLVGRLIEQSQVRVEGSNFDVRKHLLEYDDVLNAQRKRIYEQRERVFTKEDLSDDVTEMLRTELQTRIPQGLKDPEGPWKLLAFLEDIQPAIAWQETRYPSFTMRLLIDEVLRRRPEHGADANALKDVLLDLAKCALEGEHEHITRGFNDLLNRAEDSIEQQRSERFEALDNFFEGLEERTAAGPLRPQEISDELAGLTRLPSFRLNSEQIRQMNDAPEKLRLSLRNQIDSFLVNVQTARLVGAIERRMNESLNLKPGGFNNLDWAEIAEKLNTEVGALLERQAERLIGVNGQVARDLDQHLSAQGIDGYAQDEDQLLGLLLAMAQGTRVQFDRRTHRQTAQQTTRLRYVYLAAQLLGEADPKTVTERVLDHLEGASEVLRDIYGQVDSYILQQNRVPLNRLDTKLLPAFTDALGESGYTALADRTLEEVQGEQREVIESVLGWWRQNEIYRQMLLSVISELWVEYLTRVEALRVSIGMEAYAQRDPLVQYKSRASELFGELLGEIRMGVISRMFTYRPRVAQSPQAQEGGGQKDESLKQVPEKGGEKGMVAPRTTGDKKKRRRH
jgi:preprotein translocase subunit SecA